MLKAALLFPGQGSQHVGMGRDLYDIHSPARDLYDRADELLGTDLRRLSFEGPRAELTSTENAQPAILLHSVAAFRVAEERGIVPAIVAGHSLGEFSALVAAGCLDALDAARIVRHRGELMFRAGEERPGTMAAVIGLDRVRVEEICREASGEGIVVVANENSPGQLAVSGDVAAVGRAVEIVKGIEGARAVPLKVSGAFHSPLMQPARDELEAYLNEFTFRDPRCGVVANVSGEILSAPDDIRAALADQLTSPVLWTASMRRLRSEWAGPIFEVGPGKILGGLMKKIDGEAVVVGLGDVASLEGFDATGEESAGA